MLDTAHALDAILQAIRRPGDFYFAGTSEIFAPNLEVTGVGTIALPLLPSQAEELVAVAERAPYGRGEDTLVDTDVRRTWQIGPERIRIGGRHWSRSLSGIVERCAAGLGVAEPVSAELYKMLIYDTGSFFVEHRDTEKTPGMFATLVVVLPSICTGGELVVRHRGREVCLDLACPEASEAAFAAFYADCVHEVRPVTSGCRLVLVYNLVRTGARRPVEPPAYDAEEERIAALLRRWVADLAAPGKDAPEKLIYPLEHVYTPAEIGFAGLKNADAARAAVLVAAAGRAQCEVHLALVAIEESGIAEYAGPGWRGRRYSEPMDDDFEAGEVCERTLTLSAWQRPDGIPPGLPDMPFADGELCPPDAFEDVEPDEQLFHEATGNEGASFERSYRRAALVLWPQAARLEVIASAGLAVSLPYLDSLTQAWLENGAQSGSPAWHEAHRLAGLILDAWPMRNDEPGGRPGDVARLLASLTRLGDAAHIATTVAEVCAKGRYDEGDNDALAGAIALLPPGQAADLLDRLIARNAPWRAAACASLLARVAVDVAARAADAAARLEPAAAALLAALPGDPARGPAPNAWPRPAPVTPALVVELLAALHRLDALAMAERAVAHVLAWPQVFPLDAILVPAAVDLAGRADALRTWPPTARLRAACLEHLERRLAEELSPPADFARPSALPCRCRDCAELSAFLADPVRKTWVFRAAEARRRHVADSIRRADCDVDAETDRSGRPYALVCAKNAKSYQRRVAQRKKDLTDRARLMQT